MDLFDHLLFVLALSGLIVNTSKPDNIRIKEDMIHISQGSQLIRIRFKNKIVYDVKMLDGRKNYLLSVCDWFEVNTQTIHDLPDCLEVGRDLKPIKKIYFYPSYRNTVGGRDLVAHYHMSERQVKNPDNDEIYIRILVNRELAKYGLKSKLVHDERETRYIIPESLETFEEICSKVKSFPSHYAAKINKQISLWKKRKQVNIHSI